MNLTELKARHAKGEAIDFLFFWGHGPAPNGVITKSCLSQWWHAPFVVNGETFLTAEHWMMAAKARLFNDVETRTKILAATEPRVAKALGRKVRGFDETTWQQARYNLVVTGNIQKFKQNPELAAFLLETGDRVLVEASPYDPIWGIGLRETSVYAKRPDCWPGTNLLGFALMEVRKELQA